VTAREPGRAYLAACTIYRDDADYLGEWIEFHRLMGVERLVLYDNGSSDNHLDVLAPYLEEGLATRHEWPLPFLGQNGRPAAMVLAFEHCLATHRNDARWIAFLDIDEFLFSPTGASLPEVLSGYEEACGLVVNRAEFGSSGHVTKPDGLVVESYVERRPPRPDEEVAYKSIVAPRRAAYCLGAHSFVYSDGLPVDEDMRPVDPFKRTSHKPIAWSRLRIHHYFARSEEERLKKAEMWWDIGGSRALPVSPMRGSVVKDEMLTRYGPAVREALARRGPPRT
jgi:hypothetical protein